MNNVKQNKQQQPHIVFAQVVLIVIIGLMAFLIYGEEQERQQWQTTPSTISLYTTKDVCIDNTTNKILNCGHCGECSNIQDIQIYHHTAATLTNIMTNCAKKDLFFNQDAFTCLRQNSGLSVDCAKCWIKNYECNVQNCARTCIKQRLFPFLPSWQEWNNPQNLDPCITCDEKLCGPIFLECAGANRRRVGVVSDIQRDHQKEICNKVDWDWILQQKEHEHGHEQRSTISSSEKQEEHHEQNKNEL
jgi:hypothetical protein